MLRVMETEVTVAARARAVSEAKAPSRNAAHHEKEAAVDPLLAQS
jgi:hypothetical protein